MQNSPSLVVKDRYDGQIEELRPVDLAWSQNNKLSQERRISLDAGETSRFSISLQLAKDFPNTRPQIPGMLYLSSNNGINGHLVEPNCAFVMNAVHLLKDDKSIPFNLNAKQDILVVVVDGRLGVRVME